MQNDKSPEGNKEHFTMCSGWTYSASQPEPIQGLKHQKNFDTVRVKWRKCFSLSVLIVFTIGAVISFQVWAVNAEERI